MGLNAKKKHLKIFLIRHGRTAGNLEHRYVGATDEDVLPEALRELKEKRGGYPRADIVLSSPMKRCIQTAEALFPQILVRTLDGLRECDFGEFEYKNFQELRQDTRYQAWIDSGGVLDFPGGESREAFAARCCAAFEEGCRLAAGEGCDSAAFVVHGGTVMAVLDRYSNPHRDYFDWQAKNGEGYATTLAFDDKGRMMLINICPLPAASIRQFTKAETN